VFERVALNDDFVEFLTLPAYDELLKLEKQGVDGPAG
jgi:hypothetical protein